MYIYMYTCIYIYIYICIEREREKCTMYTYIINKGRCIKVNDN